MGEGPSSLVVADAGPLIHLNEVGGLPLLAMFGGITVPMAVWHEAVTYGTVPEDKLRHALDMTVRVVDREQIEAIRSLTMTRTLHRGEIECLALAHHDGMHLLLTDDMAARDAARALGIQPVGSLGIIARNVYVGRLSLPEAVDMLERLYRVSSLYVTRAIIDQAIDEMRQKLS